MVKKIILTTIMLALVAGMITTGSVAFAQQGGGNPNGNPFDDLWDAIADLQTQINDIELMPGPEGPPGQDGVDGTDGELVGLDCSTDQIAKFDGSKWVCDNMNPAENIPSTYFEYGNSVTVLVGHTFDRTSTAKCDPGDKVLSGGEVTTDLNHVTPSASYPTNDFDGWNVAFGRDNISTSDPTATAIAYCLDLDPLRS